MAMAALTKDIAERTVPVKNGASWAPSVLAMTMVYRWPSGLGKSLACSGHTFLQSPGSGVGHVKICSSCSQGVQRSTERPGVTSLPHLCPHSVGRVIGPWKGRLRRRTYKCWWNTEHGPGSWGRSPGWTGDTAASVHLDRRVGTDRKELRGSFHK